MANEIHDQSEVAFLLHREGVNDPATYGVPLISGTPRALCLATEGHVGNPNTITSAIAKRLPGPTKRVSESGQGPLSVELFPGAQLQEFLEMGFASLITAELGISAATIGFTAPDTIADSANGLAAVLPFSWVEVRGSTANSQRWWVTAVDPGGADITVAGGVVVTEAAGPTIEIVGRHLRNGQDKISATFERNNQDGGTTPFQHYPGFTASGVTLTMPFESFMTVELPGNSCGPQARTALSVFDALTPIPAETIVDKDSDSHNNMQGFREDLTLNANIREFSITNALNLEPIKVSQPGKSTLGQSLGTPVMTGTLNGYQIDAATRIGVAHANTPISFHIEVVPDVPGPGAPIMVITLHRVKFVEQGDVGKAGNTGAVPLDLTWTAEESTDVPDVWITFSIFDQV
jgi:hypothetical protein